jgi:hypothetical protein
MVSFYPQLLELRSFVAIAAQAHQTCSSRPGVRCGKSGTLPVGCGVRSRPFHFEVMKISPKEKATRIDLGLDILRATRPGEQLSPVEIAAYCDCTPGRIRQIERKALARLRRGLGKELTDNQETNNAIKHR